MATKKATHIVTHSKLCLAVGGKMQRMAIGDPITLDNKVGDRLIEKGFIKKVGEKATIEVGGDPTDDQIADAKKIIEISEAKAKKAADLKKAEEAKKAAETK